MTLTDFLLARIAEDEAFARKAERDSVVWAPGDAGVCDEQGSHVGYPPGRVLAECEAKRGVIEASWRAELQIEDEWGHSRSREQLEAEGIYPDVLKFLALPYADHPDYDESWRP